MFLCCEVVECGDGGGLVDLCVVCMSVCCVMVKLFCVVCVFFYKSPENRRGQNIIKAHNVYYVYFTI